MESEAESLALWCASLPALRDQARTNGVLDRLDRDVARVREGGQARRALLKWRPANPDGSYRSWSDRPTTGIAGLPGMGRAPGVGAGQYTCPRDRCGRRATRDENGHLPVCTAFDTPMRPS